MIKIIRKVDIEKQYQHILNLELDYELATLYNALQENDDSEIVKSKHRLQEIYDELEGLKNYA